MNDHDKENINFILSQNSDQLAEWLTFIRECGDDDEVSYALDMLCTARSLVELELLEVFDTVAETDVSDAEGYLKRFRL